MNESSLGFEKRQEDTPARLCPSSEGAISIDLSVSISQNSQTIPLPNWPHSTHTACSEDAERHGMIKRQRDSFGNAGILLPKDRRSTEQDVCVYEGVYIFVIINIIMILVFFCLFVISVWFWFCYDFN